MFFSFLSFTAGSPPSTNVLETLVMTKQDVTVPKSNAKIKTNKTGRQQRAVPECLKQLWWLSMVWWLLSLNKELCPRLKARVHCRILL